MLQATNVKGKTNTKISYNKPTSVPVAASVLVNNNDVNQSMTSYLENNQKQQDDIAQYGTLDGRMLKNVTIKDKVIAKAPISATRMVSPDFADQVITPEQMAKGGTFSARIMGVLRGIHIQNIKASSYAFIAPGGKPMRLIIDGADTDGDLDKINGDDVESVDVLKWSGTKGVYSGFYNPPGDVYKYGYDGVLVITTKKIKGVQTDWIVSVGILPISPQGFYKAREFYSPKYDHPIPNSERADLRTTIFWKPNLVTGKDGSASFDFYNADGPASYRVVVEGIDEKGNIGRLVYRYKVK